MRNLIIALSIFALVGCGSGSENLVDENITSVDEATEWENYSPCNMLEMIHVVSNDPEDINASENSFLKHGISFIELFSTDHEIWYKLSGHSQNPFFLRFNVDWIIELRNVDNSNECFDDPHSDEYWICETFVLKFVEGENKLDRFHNATFLNEFEILSGNILFDDEIEVRICGLRNNIWF